TGNAATAPELRSLASAAAEIGSLLIVDEAYGEFLGQETGSAISLVNTSPNVAVTRTLSKAFGLAGLRLGYCVTSAEIVAGLRIVRLPYHLSAVTQAAATVAVESAAALLAPVATLRQQRGVLQQWARANGLQHSDSEANFVYLGRFADSGDIWQQCLDAGVLVRQSGPDGWLRVSVGTHAENEQFMTVMSQIMARQNVLTDPRDSPS
ncbi:MAG: aminotransferase class I/II-fold pyridoxal phosphate-dependent enzyme, partial [Actinomycetia bacterium]|nr:aminotransferase class I/II-fold pyridoxal phosphate-dependent enzyme [Actinomycetes bacterium]